MAKTVFRNVFYSHTKCKFTFLLQKKTNYILLTMNKILYDFTLLINEQIILFY